MKTFKDYTEVSTQIHAPEELKRRVLMEARRTRMEQSRGHYSRGLRFVQKAAVAAVLTVALPVTAFGAVKGLGLLDHLQERGMENIEAVQELSSTGAELSSDLEAITHQNQYAKYTVLEAVCDSESIYLAAKAEPLDTETLLLPQYIMPEDDVVNLGIEGVTDGTVREYAESLGKKIAYASIGYSVDGNHLDGGEDFAYGEDGALYYYYSARNISGEDKIILKCTGTGYDESMTMESIDRVEFVIQLTDKSSVSGEEVCTEFDPKAYEDTGIQINSLTLEKTEMGLYATFRFTIRDAEFTDIDFKIVDISGQELAKMPGIGFGTIENGDGTFSRTLYYQLPESLEGLRFLIQDINNGVAFGPYAFGE